jgi:hypothetical protein
MSCTSASTSDSRRALLRALAAGGALVAAGCTPFGLRPEPPEATIDTITLVRVSADGADLGLRLAVRNPNAFSLDIARLDYALAIGERGVANGALARPVRLAASATTLVDADVRVDFTAFRSALDGIARSGQLSYEFSGTAVLSDGTRLPFRRRAELDANKVRGLRS